MRRLLVLPLVLLLSTPGFSLSPTLLVGLEGDVTVVRAGQPLAADQVREGLVLESFDTVTTGSGSRAEVRLSGVSGVTGGLKLDPSTSVYLEWGAGRPNATLVRGRLVVVLTGQTAEPWEIRTDRGRVTGLVPGFRVTSLDEGDVLVTTASAAAQLRTADRAYRADTGNAVELAPDGTVHNLPVNADTLGAFEASWKQQKQQAFRDQPAESFRNVAGRYQRLGGTFGRAWDRYQREAKDDPRAQRSAAAQLRRAALPLERLLPALGLLRSLFQDGTLSATLELSRGYPAKDFFSQVDSDEARWWPRLVSARGLYRAVAAANSGAFPEAADGSAITRDSPYFQ